MGVWTPQAQAPGGAFARPASGSLRALLVDGPRGLVLRIALVVTLAAAVARLHSVRDPGVLCPLRALTGVPCPLCGSTTAFIEAGSGDVAGAFATQPVTAAATVVAILAPLAVVTRWRRWSRRWRIAVPAGLALASWIYQLHRFGWLG